MKNRPYNMKIDINKIRNEYFKKSFSVGYHNIKYTWMQLALVILNCIKCLESIEEGTKSPSPQTIRDRLLLKGSWISYYDETMWKLARYMLKRFPRFQWFISIDETHIPFFGDRKKLNKKLIKEGLGQLVFGYRAKTPGATGSFCFLVVSLCCCKVRIPIAVKMMKVRERYLPWLEPVLKRLKNIAPKAIVLADRGFGKATWFFLMLENLDVDFVVRIPLRKKENKNKVKSGANKLQYWMKDNKTKDKVLMTVRIAKDKQNRKYLLATNLDNKTNKQVLTYYLNRWDIENIFKDADRVTLKTSSTNPMMRLFSTITSFFIFALWQTEKILKTAFCSLRQFVKQIIETISEILKVILTPLGRIIQNTPT